MPTQVRVLEWRLLPWAELFLGGLLSGLFVRQADWGSTAAVPVFTVLIVANLVQGDRVDCHCLGGGRQSPISWASVLLNGVLGVASVTAAYGPKAGAVPGLVERPGATRSPRSSC